MDEDRLQALEDVTEELRAAVARSDYETAVEALARRGVMLKSAAAEARTGEASESRLARLADVGRDVKLRVTARRERLRSQLEEAQRSLRAHAALRPHRATTGGRIDVTS